MKTRDRVASGKKAAETNRKKDQGYYPNMGKLGGRAVHALQRVFSLRPELASYAAHLRHKVGPGQTVQYLVKSAGFHTEMFRNRPEARAFKKRVQLEAPDALPRIIRIVYAGDDTSIIFEEREIW